MELEERVDTLAQFRNSDKKVSPTIAYVLPAYNLKILFLMSIFLYVLYMVDSTKHNASV